MIYRGFTFGLLTNLKNYIMATSNKKSADSVKASDKKMDKKESGSKAASGSKKESGSSKK